MHVRFYHVLNNEFLKSVCKLVQKVYTSGYRLQLHSCDNDDILELDKLIWTMGQTSFVPHAMHTDPDNHAQPILLANDETNRNHANILMKVGLQEVAQETYPNIIYIFNGLDKAQVEKSRKNYKHYLDQDIKIDYYRQQEDGSWMNVV